MAGIGVPAPLTRGGVLRFQLVMAIFYGKLLFVSWLWFVRFYLTFNYVNTVSMQPNSALTAVPGGSNSVGPTGYCAPQVDHPQAILFLRGLGC